MSADRGAARIAGALFLLAMAASLAGGALLEDAIAGPDHLASLREARPRAALGIGLELVNALAVVGIAAALYPVLRRRNEGAAIGYLGLRLLESFACVLAALMPLALIALARDAGAPGNAAGNVAQYAAPLLLALRAQGTALLVPLFFSLGALVFYSLALRARLLPRFITVWGLVAVVLVLAVNLFQPGIALSMLLALPIIANEIFLGVWLLAKGFED